MSNKINIHCCSFDYTSQLEEQRKLFIDCFPENKGMPIITENYYLWKFQSKPSPLKHSFEYIALKDSTEMVGYYACIPYQYKIEGRKYQAGMVCDVMTSSKYRGAGIFTKLGYFATNEFASEGIAFSTGYPIRKAPLPGHLKVGWKIMFDMPLYMRFLRVDSLFKQKGYGWAKFFVNPFVTTHNLLCWKPDNKKVRIKIFNNIYQVIGYSEFEYEWRAGLKNALVKSIDFMRWRLSAPKKNYKFICAYSDDKLIGMAITTSIIKEGVPSIGIIDFTVLNAHRYCLNSIHKAIYKLAFDNNEEAIMTMMSHSSCKKYKMIGNGYLRSPFTFHFIIKKFDESIPDDILSNEENWELRFIDSDDL